MYGEIAGAVCVVAIAAAMGVYYTMDALADHKRRTREAEVAAGLKQQMIDKGFPADDIVRVIEARPAQPDKA